ncbi:MAG TPA: lytic transglycosylase domain-containing protein, partial [Stellaceae bacterium]|nr:lytic transglycosylase domain-containing protein [Stellaceae bacterium]
AEADAEIARLKDPLLLGHVLAERYLSKPYRASYRELADWLEHYADEPDAKAIYALALERKPRGAKAPPKPVEAAAALAEDTDDAAFGFDGLSPRARLVAREIGDLAATAPKRAAALLDGAEAKRLLDPATRETLRSTIAAAVEPPAREPHAALDSGAAPGGPALSPAAQWEAGLAAWRLDRMTEAREHFQTLARVAAPSSWLRSAGAFWAARAAQRLHRRDHVRYWLHYAAEQPRTFYGLIARRLLGIDADLDFSAEPFTALDARVVTSLAAGRRALALIEIDQRQRATAELRALAAGNDPALLQSLAGVADRADLPALSLQLAGLLAETDGRNHDSAFFPVPRWRPKGGFSIDRALLYAVMRQESLFVPRVTSEAGAEGLMQLMPGTARDMAERKGVSLDGKALADPELNLTLAQEYVRVLLKDTRIKGDLLLFALAYNRGPAAVQRLDSLAAQYRKDPLLFLESVPGQETRLFTKHVLTNYWIHRQRLGQPTRDLDALAHGKWPTYRAYDAGSDQGGRYAAN